MKKILFLILLAIPFISVKSQDFAEKKLIEMKKIITFTSIQEKKIREIYTENLRTNDSIIYNVKDPVLASELKYKSNKKLNDNLMSVLDESQRIKYIRVISTPEVNEKVKAKVALLQEKNTYTQSQVDSISYSMFEYLMLEKYVYAKDKYDVAKQKENIRRLKRIEPGSIKESNTVEKIKAQGKLSKNKINW